MTADTFRRIALGMADAVEGAHMGHPDFRAQGRIFATLHPDLRHGMVNLSPEDQQVFVQDHPTTFTPENGAWGRQGCTKVRLASAEADTVGEAMTLAWQNTVRKAAAKKVRSTPKAKPRAAAPSPKPRAKRVTERAPKR